MATVITDLRAKLRRILAQAFPNARVQLDHSKASDKYSGMMLWDGFDGQDQVDRQTRLWEVLRARLSPEEQQRVTAILTLTPAERRS
jgi:hypothetical protein